MPNNKKINGIGECVKLLIEIKQASLICLENLCPLSAHVPHDRVVFTTYQGGKKKKKGARSPQLVVGVRVGMGNCTLWDSFDC
jgi:hypothetical protein